MEITSPKQQALPDFVLLKQRFEEMEKGHQAEIKRVASISGVADLPTYYRWLKGYGADMRMQRIAFMLPHVKHKVDTPTLGQQLYKAGISEMRLFQIVRSESPRDLEQLRRLVIQAEPKLDWGEFGKTLYFWGKQAKQRLLEQYFTPIKTQQ
ncbi:MAG: type I-E CRISPR-associated protein Cse2/CasB [Candidatus Thiodiazotropha sp. (ex Lucinoma kastoroae)]|nr:type I-E CRISPR-associated protein Cse2/CasB [Candidatus Thiodiazotropha sp. (ex Lucinoma kastoroae)]